MSLKAIKLTTDGEIQVIDWPEGDNHFKILRWMQDMVDGAIEIVRPMLLERPYVMIVDDAGLIKEDDPKLNPVGSVLYGFLEHGQPIAGTALILQEVMTPDGADLTGIAKDKAEDLAGSLKWIHDITSLPHPSATKLCDGGWINAAIELPKGDERVLCVKQLKDGRLDMCFGYYDGEGYDWNEKEHRQSFIKGRWVTTGSNNNVKWWMRLPIMPRVL